MKKILYIVIVISFLSCEKIIDPDKPDISERSREFVLQIIDSTNTYKPVYGIDYVQGAEIKLKSNLLETNYEFISDEDGRITLSNIVSGDYLISVSKDVTPEEMEIAHGEKKFQQRLVNSKMGVIELRADNEDVVQINLDKIVVNSDLVISEIYASGPPEAGLYFHDKYVEIFNQSDSIKYLDGLVIAKVYFSPYYGIYYTDDADFVHSKSIWKFPGKGKDYPIMPKEYKVVAEDGMDHTINAPYSIDLSKADFEFYKKDSPDIDNEGVPNMIMFYQPYGYDWLIGGESDALVLAKVSTDSLILEDEKYLIPTSTVIDGVEYLRDAKQLDKKALYPGIDAGATGSIEFYTGKTMERILIRESENAYRLKDDNNSSIDFKVYSHPSPGFHNEF